MSKVRMEVKIQSEKVLWNQKYQVFTFYGKVSAWKSGHDIKPLNHRDPAVLANWVGQTLVLELDQKKELRILGAVFDTALHVHVETQPAVGQMCRSRVALSSSTLPTAYGNLPSVPISDQLCWCTLPGSQTVASTLSASHVAVKAAEEWLHLNREVDFDLFLQKHEWKALKLRAND